MRRLHLIVLFLGLGMCVQAQQTINWISFDEAVKLQKKKPKKIFMDVYTEWCGPCKMLDRNTFQNADLIKYVNDNYYAVKFNAEGNETVTYGGKTYKNPQYVAGKTGRNSVHELTYELKVAAYPTMLIFNEDGTLIHSFRGYQTPKQLEIYMKLFAKDDYKTIDTQQKWQDYQANFVNTFSE